ncbi:hypothetical protein R4Z09_20730 [Niallia oryzisoli]|uniref:Uncharacterized protein n=1 Tax=Niallia oryzisoli TaxID=1737571 RepID=A0ABZ2C7Y3_9BACI
MKNRLVQVILIADDVFVISRNNSSLRQKPPWLGGFHVFEAA